MMIFHTKYKDNPTPEPVALIGKVFTMEKIKNNDKLSLADQWSNKG